ncbi:MAG TPA: hypothetical protein VF319_14600 [Caldimonas sp.]
MVGIHLLGSTVSVGMLRLLWIGLFVVVCVGIGALVVAYDRLASKEPAVRLFGNESTIHSTGGV